MKEHDERIFIELLSIALKWLSKYIMINSKSKKQEHHVKCEIIQQEIIIGNGTGNYFQL